MIKSFCIVPICTKQKMTDEYNPVPRPLKRNDDCSDDRARIQALLSAHGGVRRSICSSARVKGSHPMVQRCTNWANRANGTESEEWHTAMSKLDIPAMSRLRQSLEQVSGVEPYRTVDPLNEDDFNLESDLQQQVDGWARLTGWVQRDHADIEMCDRQTDP